jgi:hypothetical protein
MNRGRAVGPSLAAKFAIGHSVSPAAAARAAWAPLPPVFEDRGAAPESSSGHDPRPCSGTSSGRNMRRHSGELVRPRPALLGGASPCPRPAAPLGRPHLGTTCATARGSLSDPRRPRPWGRSGRERHCPGREADRGRGKVAGREK